MVAGLNFVSGAGLSKLQEQRRRASALDVRIDPVRRSLLNEPEICAFFVWRWLAAWRRRAGPDLAGMQVATSGFNSEGTIMSNTPRPEEGTQPSPQNTSDAA